MSKLAQNVPAKKTELIESSSIIHDTDGGFDGEENYN
jgi:hypothetical protein